MATDTRTAMIPYSITVAPRSSVAKRRIWAAVSVQNILASLRVSICKYPALFVPSQQSRKMRHQRLVRRRHRIVAQPVRPHPGESLALPCRHGAFPATTNVERHQQMKFLIGMAREGERGEAGFPHRDAQFLAKLAHQRVLRALALLDLAAGKFP